MPGSTLYPRFVNDRLWDALAYSPAVLLQGPRQCGKTTLALSTAAPGNATQAAGQAVPASGNVQGFEYVSFDDDAMRASAETDPMGFAADLRDRVILDEVQRVPGLFAALKLEIDRHRLPGRFLLTGSANVLQTARLADSLAGRMQTVRLHPLSQCELARNDSGFLDSLFGGRFEIARSGRLGHELAERIEAGGYPAALLRPAGRMRSAWYRDYLDSIVHRDLLDLGRRGLLDVSSRLVEVAVSQTARLFNAADLAAPFQVSRPTIRDYLALLERVFLLERVPPWHSNRLSRLVKTPKLHIGDTGLACALLGARAGGLMANRALLGQLLETFVFQELRRQASWHEEPMAFFHYRDRDNAEVDIVIERGVGGIAGVEVKASGTASPSDFRGLRKLANATGDRFACGVVLYDGEMTARFGKGLYAVPISRLWTSN